MDGKDVLLWITYIVEGMIIVAISFMSWITLDFVKYKEIINGALRYAFVVLMLFLMLQILAHWIISVGSK